MNYGLKTSLTESLRNYALASKRKGKRTHKENKTSVSQAECLKMPQKGIALRIRAPAVAWATLGCAQQCLSSCCVCPVPLLPSRGGSSDKDPAGHQNQGRALLGASGARSTGRAV